MFWFHLTDKRLFHLATNLGHLWMNLPHPLNVQIAQLWPTSVLKVMYHTYVTMCIIFVLSRLASFPGSTPVSCMLSWTGAWEQGYESTSGLLSNYVQFDDSSVLLFSLHQTFDKILIANRGEIACRVSPSTTIVLDSIMCYPVKPYGNNPLLPTVANSINPFDSQCKHMVHVTNFNLQANK